MTPLPLLDGNTLLIDNSSLESFTTCPRQAQYAIARRLRATGDRVPLRFGGNMHKVLEARYRTVIPYAQSPDVEQAMVSIARDEFIKWSPPEDDYRNYDRMVDLIKRYGEQYGFEPFEIVTFPDGRPFIEIPFAVPLGRIVLNGPIWVTDIANPTVPAKEVSLDSLNIVWTGRIDMAFRINGRLYILDHKSSSMATNMAEFEIAHQFYGYVWTTEQLLGEEVAGFMINRVVVRKPSRTGEPFGFDRKPVPVQRGLLNEWHNDCLHIVSDFVEMCRRDYLPKHTAWCVGKFGTCPFHLVCTLDTNEQREVMLASGNYERNDWSPLT